MFFSFDGIDGAGKSTQIGLLAAWLRAKGKEVVTCRDPGSTELGEKLRGLLLEHHGTPIDRRSEMLMYMAARAQLEIGIADGQRRARVAVRQPLPGQHHLTRRLKLDRNLSTLPATTKAQ